MPRKCPSVRSGRYLINTHSIWSTARGGGGAYIANGYNYPDPILICTTLLLTSYWIERPHLTFDTHKIKAGIIAAKLKLYVTERTDIPSELYITKGAHNDIVYPGPSVWAAQNAYTDIGGQTLFSDLRVDAWNEIPLNSLGISLINSSPLEKKQYEGFDDGLTADYNLFSPLKQSMSFTPIEKHTIKSVRLLAKRLGAGGCGIVTVNIRAADVNHFPTGGILATGQFDSATLPTTYDWTGHIDLGSGALLAADTEYCIELDPTGGDVTHQAKFWGSTNGAYERGRASYFDVDAIWKNHPVGYDMSFLEFSNEDVGGTRLCLRTGLDFHDNPPPVVTYSAAFRAYDAFLEVTLGALGKQKGFELRGSGFRP